MPARGTLVLSCLALAVLTALPWSRAATAQTATPPHEIPQSLQIDHRETIERLVELTHRKGQVGIEAKKVLALFQAHTAREEAYIMPPLTLLPYIADGKVTPDMKWALAMCDRVKADREEILHEHEQLTDAMNALFNAADHAHDHEAREFAEGAVADSLNDLEILEPTVLIIGDILRARLPAGQ
jgi:hypothetical protein